MKQINQRIFIAAVVVGGLFIGAVKGHEARLRWITKMKVKDEKKIANPHEVVLDDYEIASFHNS